MKKYIVLIGVMLVIAQGCYINLGTPRYNVYGKITINNSNNILPVENLTIYLDTMESNHKWIDTATTSMDGSFAFKRKLKKHDSACLYIRYEIGNNGYYGQDQCLYIKNNEIKKGKYYWALQIAMFNEERMLIKNIVRNNLKDKITEIANNDLPDSVSIEICYENFIRDTIDLHNFIVSLEKRLKEPKYLNKKVRAYIFQNKPEDILDTHRAEDVINCISRKGLKEQEVKTKEEKDTRYFPVILDGKGFPKTVCPKCKGKRILVYFFIDDLT